MRQALCRVFSAAACAALVGGLAAAAGGLGVAAPAAARPVSSPAWSAGQPLWLSRVLAEPHLTTDGKSRASGPLRGELRGVAARTGRDAWAVGSYCVARCGSLGQASHALIEHWDGTSWAKVRLPRLGSTDAELRTVSADAADDAWAAGDLNPLSRAPTSVMLHWTGTRWVRVSIPKPRVYQEESVAARAPKDVWEVGFRCLANCGRSSQTTATVILHWNGTTWAKVPSPNPGKGGSVLTGVTALSARNAWAVGSSCVSGCAIGAPHVHTLILHWNGRSWARVPSPNPHPFSFFIGVSAHAAAGVWAVGQSCYNCHPLAVHRVAGRWVTAPTPKLSDGFPLAVDTISATNAWAVGGYCASGCSAGNEKDVALLLHWNGSRWSKIRTGLPSNAYSYLEGAGAASATAAWAVGAHCPASAPNCQSPQILIKRLNSATKPAR